MSNIVKLTEMDASELRLVEKSLIGLRKCYPQFGSWYESKVLPNLKDNTRRIFLASDINGFSGAMILKSTPTEKKVCTLYVRDDARLRHIGVDLVRIATEELETYTLPITVSEEAKDWFFNNSNFNFYTKQKVDNCYIDGQNEYFGYIMCHNFDNELRRNKNGKRN